jgi:hypothetical protein
VRRRQNQRRAPARCPRPALAARKPAARRKQACAACGGGLRGVCEVLHQGGSSSGCGQVAVAVRRRAVRACVRRDLPRSTARGWRGRAGRRLCRLRACARPLLRPFAGFVANARHILQSVARSSWRWPVQGADKAASGRRRRPGGRLFASRLEFPRRRRGAVGRDSIRTQPTTGKILRRAPPAVKAKPPLRARR